MRHRTVKKLKAKIKTLKSEIRELKSKKPALLNSTLQWEHDPVDIDALIEHFKRNKYG